MRWPFADGADIGSEVMRDTVLITGGAGFVGSHLADELLENGYHVRCLDCLSSQIHSDSASRPDYLNDEVELIRGDIRDREVVRNALSGATSVVHLAAMVGVGQSMYRIADYTAVNNLGTAVLLEALTQHPVQKLVVASSMSIYGEGLYQAPDGSVCSGHDRSLEALKAREWELCNDSGQRLVPVPTPEWKQPSLASVYALSKYDQERMCLITGRAYNIPTVALRFFNIYGTRQALSNPYTGVLAIFASRYLNDQPPLINEDGNQMRDFVHVRDVVAACRLSLEKSEADGGVFNIGSGHQLSVNDVAVRMGHVLGKESIEPEITGRYRMGDIRHCFADISHARSVLGYEPKITFEEGMTELAEWLSTQTSDDRVVQANEELSRRGLTV
jgi:dTDP-L-rhamnose 4-epimerase